VRFKDFIAKIHPLPRPVRLTPVIPFKMDKLGRPRDWSQVPVGTRVYWYVNRWGGYSTRRTNTMRTGTFLSYTPIDNADRHVNEYPVRVRQEIGSATFAVNEVRILV
jgi:hypothetical protein